MYPNNVPPTSPGGNNWRGPGNLNQIGDLAILNASMGSSSPQAPSPGNELLSCSRGGNGGALAIPSTSAGPNLPLNLGLSGVLQFQLVSVGGNNFMPPPSFSPGQGIMGQEEISFASTSSGGQGANASYPLRSPVSPASIPSPGYNPPGLPPIPEDNFSTPPRPDALCGENLNVSNASNNSGGLESTERPNFNDSPCSNASNRSGGLESVGRPDLNDSPCSNASNNSGGLDSIQTPNFNDSPCSNASNNSGGPNQNSTPPLNVTDKSGLSGVFMPSFNSTFSDGAPVTSSSCQRSPNLMQFSPDRSPANLMQFSPSPNLIQFSPDNPNQGNRQLTSADREMFPQGPGRNFGGTNGFGITPIKEETSPNQYQGYNESDVSRIADIAFPTSPSTQSSPCARSQAPVSNDDTFGARAPNPPPTNMVATPDTPCSPQTAAMNQMVREAHEYLAEVLASTPVSRAPTSPAPMVEFTPSPLPLMRNADIRSDTPASLNSTFGAAWTSFDDRYVRENQPSTPGTPTGYGNWGIYNQSIQSSPNSPGTQFANTTLSPTGGCNQSSLNSSMVSSGSQQPNPPSPFAYQASPCSGNRSNYLDRSGGGPGAGPGMVLACGGGCSQQRAMACQGGVQSPSRLMATPSRLMKLQMAMLSPDGGLNQLPPPPSTNITAPPNSIPRHLAQRLASIPNPPLCPRFGEYQPFQPVIPFRGPPPVGTLEQRLSSIPEPPACFPGSARPGPMQQITPACGVPKTRHSRFQESTSGRDKFYKPVAGEWSDGVGGPKIKGLDENAGMNYGKPKQGLLDGQGGRKPKGVGEDY